MPDHAATRVGTSHYESEVLKGVPLETSDGEREILKINTKSNFLHAAHKSLDPKPLARPSIIALDGNNNFGQFPAAKTFATMSSADAMEIMAAMKHFVEKVSQAGIKVHLFWDGSFVYHARRLNLLKHNEDFHRWLCSEFDLKPQNVTVTKKGIKVDGVMLIWALDQGASIIRNDKFSKENEDRYVIEVANRLKSEGRILPATVAGNLLIVEELSFVYF